MSSVNKVILIGNLGRDPEGRAMTSGDRVVSFSVATAESWRDKQTGERKDRTEWHNVVIFNDALGKIAEQYLRKGSKVYLEGALQTRTYTDKTGAERKATEVVLKKFRSEIVLLGKSENGPAGEESYGTTSTRAGSGANQSGGAQDYKNNLDDDIPF